MRENKIEKYLVSQVNRIGGLCLKFVSPGNSGVPDRIVMFQGTIVFVELKAPGEHTRPLQNYITLQIQKQNFPVVTIDRTEGVDWLVKLLVGLKGANLEIHSARIPESGNSV